ncbi:MAG: TetR/AcrR family transcriptional regulator [Pseudomonadota bacterium]|jgi:AcrR family transcriptional regulator|uniref:TetR family transcriptional regulator n=1 Tax=Marinomonas communis TaxID=28254 RepID=A0A4R6X7Y4_9GAMM|nr:TetR/AcrR family transcriptional regulator [Marinomonas communis]MEC8081314.1 TetR/AcrR family transcriptional regulator [Pseudomonadota bacterium]TDR14069.1 TetR family transcriptional regulator [Marinomonas communis]
MTKKPTTMKTMQSVSPRSEPVQSRSIKRTQQILEVTSNLLETVGLNDLNTAIIAKEVGISVGSLYHYFPNKHAILYAMGKSWLDSIEEVLNDIEEWPVESLSLEDFIDQVVDINLRTYRQQKAVLRLVQAMFSVPELRELDERHDDMVISQMAKVFKRLGINKHIRERERIARHYLEVTHSSYLVIVNQNEQRATRTLQDLKIMLQSLLAHHLKSPE